MFYDLKMAVLLGACTVERVKITHSQTHHQLVFNLFQCVIIIA